jgi:hypothetical protein
LERDMADQAPKIQVDSDWKAQAQAEKERLAQQRAPASAGGAAGGQAASSASASAAARSTGGLPAANFETLISTMATQALFAMGAIPDPRTGQRMQHLDLARHHIDMLGVIEAKSKGNLSEDEADLLSSTLFELRQRYVQLASATRG